MHRPLRGSRPLRLLLLWLALLAGAEAAHAQQLPAAEALREALRDRVGLPLVPGESSVDSVPLQAREELTRLYLLRFFQPAWISVDGTPLPQAQQFAERLGQVESDGLRAATYRQRVIAERIAALTGDPASITLEQLVDLEMLLTDAWLTLADHLLRGRLDPEQLQDQTLATPRELDLVVLLDTALAEGDPVGALDSLQPTYPQYARLREALARYRELALQPEPPALPAGAALRIGDLDERVPLLRQRLRYHGDLGEDAALDSPRFDGEVDAAVLRFQARHGLEADGIVGRGSRAALNVAHPQRVQQIEANLERFRWLPQSLEPRHLRVNIADFSLEVIEEGQRVLAMDVIVGRPYRQTPVFSGRLTYLVFSPYWHIPDSIARKDILPRAQREPEKLVADGYRALSGWGANEREIDLLGVDWSRYSRRNLPYRFRQDPGPRNALGRVKFMLPNRFSVYLHDTPAQELFDRNQRDFSSGCVRVSQPLELATYLLRDDPRWSAETIRAAMDSGTEQNVSVPRAVPVYVYYLTAWVDDAGLMQFREDIYERDRRLLEALGAN
ncbi:MAG TPA: L,D-transpeptidase family protein [Gammaproteobacteria bacterium]